MTYVPVTSAAELNEDVISAQIATISAIIRERLGDVDTTRGALSGLLTQPAAVLAAVRDENRNRAADAFSLTALAQGRGDSSLLENYGISLRSATVASGVVRLTFREPLPVTIAAGTTFSDVYGNAYSATSTSVVRINEDAVERDGDLFLRETSDGLYFVDIAVTANVEGVTGTRQAGDVFSASTSLQNLVDIVAVADFVTGTNATDPVALASDILAGLSQPGWGSTSAISKLAKTVLADDVQIRLIRFGDVELRRNSTSAFSISQPGSVDLYVRDNSGPEITEVVGTLSRVTDSAGRILVSPPYSSGAYEILSFTSGAGNTYQVTDSRPQDETLAYSSRGSLVADILTGSVADADFGEGLATVRRVGRVAEMQALADDPENGFFGGDLLVRAFLPSYVSVQVNVYDPDNVINIPALQGSIASIISSANIDTQITTGMLIQRTLDVVPASASIRNFVFTARTQLPDGTFREWSRDDAIEVADARAVQGLTQRTTTYYCSAHNVVVTSYQRSH